MTKLHHFDNEATARFITFGTHRRYPVFADERAVAILLRHLDRFREAGIKIVGYVVMPDHVHLELWPPCGLALTRIIGRMKGRVAQEIIARWRADNTPVPPQVRTPGREREHTIWQRRCYDRNIRDASELRKTLEYCHANPLVAGLVSAPEDWPWSSYAWYQGRTDVPLAIDAEAL